MEEGTEQKDESDDRLCVLTEYHSQTFIIFLIQTNILLSVQCQNKRVNINKDELKSTSKAIETVHNLCCNENKGATELVAELGTLYQCIR